MNREHFETGILDHVEENKLVTAVDNKQEILDEITEIARTYDYDKTVWNSEEPYTMTYFYYGRHVGSLLAERIGEMMHEKYPTQDFEIRIKHGEYSVEVSLL